MLGLKWDELMLIDVTTEHEWWRLRPRSTAKLCKLGMRNFEMELIYCRNSNNPKHKHLPKRLTVSSSHELTNNEEYIFLLDLKLCTTLGSTIVTSTMCTVINWYRIVMLYPILKAAWDHIKRHLIIQRSSARLYKALSFLLLTEIIWIMSALVIDKWLHPHKTTVSYYWLMSYNPWDGLLTHGSKHLCETFAGFYEWQHISLAQSSECRAV